MERLSKLSTGCLTNFGIQETRKCLKSSSERWTTIWSKKKRKRQEKEREPKPKLKKVPLKKAKKWLQRRKQRKIKKRSQSQLNKLWQRRARVSLSKKQLQLFPKWHQKKWTNTCLKRLSVRLLRASKTIRCQWSPQICKATTYLCISRTKARNSTSASRLTKR